MRLKTYNGASNRRRSAYGELCGERSGEKSVVVATQTVVHSKGEGKINGALEGVLGSESDPIVMRRGTVHKLWR